MKVEIIFLTAVLGITAIHLLTNIANFLSRFIRTSAQANHKTQMRNGWYVFFDKSDLYGTMDSITTKPKTAPESAVESAPISDDCQAQKAYA